MDDALELSSVSLPKGPHGLDLRPRRVQQWLSQLPLANLGQTSGSIYETLRLSNQKALSAAHRIGFLEAVRPSFCFALMKLRKRYGLTAFPTTERDLQLQAFTEALLSEVFQGFELALSELQARRAVSSLAALAIQRMIRCRSGQILERYRFYQPPPPGAWQDIHRLYQSAVALNLAHVRVEDDGVTGRGRCTVRRAYKQILLLAAMQPASLRHQEMDALFAALRRVAAQADLGPAAASKRTRYSYFVDPTSDQGPRRNALGPDGSGLWLHCGRFVLPTSESGRIRGGRMALRNPRGRSIPPQIEGQIRQRLSREHQPRAPRQSDNTPIEMIAGLSRITREFLGQQQQTTRAEPATSIEAATGQWVFDKNSGKWTEVAQDPGAPPVEEAPPAIAATAATGIDLSHGGCALKIGGEVGAPLRLGDAVALYRSQPSTSRAAPLWRIGLIKWIQQQPRKSLQFGVDVMPCWPTPVLLRLAAARPEDKPFCGLILLQVQTAAAPLTLLAPHLNLRAGKQLTMIQDGQESIVLLTKEVARTAACQRFEFEPVTDEAPLPVGADNPPQFRRLYEML